MRVQTADSVAIVGFIVTGSDPKKVMVRAIGPSINVKGDPVPGRLDDPTLELHDGSGALLLNNDDWKETQQAEIEQSGLAPADDRESAIVRTLAPGHYTAIVRGKNGATGIGLVEAYDLGQSDNSKLANLSTRGLVETGDNVMIGGFILGSNTANARIAVRGIGPSLSQFGLDPVLADPTLELHDGNGATLVSNDDWQDNPTSAAQLTSFGLGLGNSKESGIFTSLPPGQFTAILAEKNGGTGIGLVEIYNLQ